MNSRARNKENGQISSLRMKTISLAEAENGNGKRTILVAGATGRVGRYVCEQVLSKRKRHKFGDESTGLAEISRIARESYVSKRDKSLSGPVEAHEGEGP